MQNLSTHEFIVWSDCNNKCEFCWAMIKENSLTKLVTHDEKRKSIVELNNKIAQIPDEHIHFMVAGGEMFYEQNSYEYTDHLAVVISNYLLSGKIKALSFNSNLIYKDLESISDFILALLELDTGVNIALVTSYDVAGRFKDEADRLLMLDNLDIITYSYPDLTVVVNTVLTSDMCEQICSGKFDPKEFERRYRVHLNFVPYIVLEERLAPSKNLLFKTYDILTQIYPPTDYVHQFDKLKRYVYRYQKGKGFSDYYSGNLACGHGFNFSKILESGECFICEYKRRYL